MDNFYNWLIADSENWVSVERNEDSISAKDKWYEIHIQEENDWFYVSIGYNDDEWKIYRRINGGECTSLTDWFADNYSTWLDELDNSIMLYSGSHWSYGRD